MMNRSCWIGYKDAGTDSERKGHQVVSFYCSRYIASATITVASALKTKLSLLMPAAAEPWTGKVISGICVSVSVCPHSKRKKA